MPGVPVDAASFGRVLEWMHTGHVRNRILRVGPRQSPAPRTQGRRGALQVALPPGDAAPAAVALLQLASALQVTARRGPPTHKGTSMYYYIFVCI